MIFRIAMTGQPINKKLPIKEVFLRVEWCRIVDSLQTSAIAATDDYKLKNLVEVFQLSGNLLDS